MTQNLAARQSSLKKRPLCGPPRTPKGTLGYVTCAQAANSTQSAERKRARQWPTRPSVPFWHRRWDTKMPVGGPPTDAMQRRRSGTPMPRGAAAMCTGSAPVHSFRPPTPHPPGLHLKEGRGKGGAGAPVPFGVRVGPANRFSPPPKALQPICTPKGQASPQMGNLNNQHTKKRYHPVSQSK